jgi:hypothetical protein
VSVFAPCRAIRSLTYTSNNSSSGRRIKCSVISSAIAAAEVAFVASTRLIMTVRSHIVRGAGPEIGRLVLCGSKWMSEVRSRRDVSVILGWSVSKRRRASLEGMVLYTEVRDAEVGGGGSESET